MVSFTQRIFKPLVTLCLCWPMLTMATDKTVAIHYTANTDTLTIKITEAYLDDVLEQLATQLNFKLALNDVDARRLVSFEMTGKTPIVLNKLIQPDSVILSQDNKPPERITNVILLPEGEESREARIRASIPAPPYSDDPAINAENEAIQERRVQRRLQGLGIHKD